MAKQVRTRNGKTITLLNSAEKGRKFAKELKNKKKYVNSNGFKTVKKDDKGREIKLTKSQASYRMGYLAARRDSANAFKSKKK